MRQISKSVVWLARHAAMIPLVSRILYALISLLPVADARKERLRGYIFSPAQLRWFSIRQYRREHVQSAEDEKLFARAYRRERFRDLQKSERAGSGRAGAGFVLKRPDNSRYGLVVYYLLWTMLTVETSGFGFLNRVLFAVMGVIPGLSGRVQRLKDTMALAIERSNSPIHGSRPVRLSDIGHRATPALRSELEKLSVFGTVHVVLEPGARLPAFLESDLLKACSFEIYSFSDIRRQAAMLDIGGRWKPATLRDRFNDISADGEALFGMSRDAAVSLVDTLGSHLLPGDLGASPRLREVIATALDDTISHRLSLVLCVRNALADVPKGDGILFVTGKQSTLADGWSLFSPHLDESRVFLASGVAKGADWRVLLAELQESRQVADAKLTDAGSPQGTAREAETLEGLARGIADSARSVAAVFAKQIRKRMSGAPVIVVAYNGQAPAYQDTVSGIREELGGRLSGGQARALFLHCAGVADRALAVGPGGRTGAAEISQIDLSRFLDVVNATRLGFGERCDLLRLLKHHLSGHVLLEGRDQTDLVVEDLTDALMEKLAWSVSGYLLARSMGQQLPLEGVLASTTRQWLVRAVCAGFLDSRGEETGHDPFRLVDVQSMNVLAHPKYRAPLATDVAVIDKLSERVHAGYLGVAPERIHVVGSVQIDRLRQGQRAFDQSKARSRFGLAEGEKAITLVSQLQPLPTMLSIANPLAEYVRARDGVKLIVRLHPREGLDRAEAYRAALSDVLAPGQFRISSEERVGDVIAASSCCVTIYSNMAREAAMFGVPVLVPRWDGIDAPFRLDEEGFAQAVLSPDAFGPAFDGIVSRDGHPDRVPAYFEENPQLLEGAASARIADLVWREDMARESSAGPVEAGMFQGRDVAIVLSPTVNPSGLPPAFMDAASVRVYGRQAANASLALPPDAILEQGGYTLKTAARFDAMVAEANAAAMMCVDAMFACRSFTPRANASLEDFREAFWLQVRPAVISACQAEMVCEQGLAGNQGSALVLAAGDDGECRRLARLALDREHQPENLFVVRLSKSGDAEWLDTASLLAAEAPDADSGISGPIVPFKGRIDLPDFDAATCGSASEQPVLFVTTDWKLKTVPATLGPVIADSLNRGERVVMALIREVGEDIREALVSFGAMPERLGRLKILVAGDLAKDTKLIPQKHLRKIAEDGQQYLAAQPSFTGLPPHIQSCLCKGVEQLSRVYLPNVLAFAACALAEMRGGSAISLGCPGRQWHCAVAHKVAAKRGLFSMTLQNAYMTAGYTYTAPSGDCITAIDDWSRNLMIEHYHCPPGAVEVFSTPRFDALASDDVPDKASARQELGAGPDEKLILFAAQYGLDEECERIVRALGEAALQLGDTARLVVKLHPRSPPDIEARFRAAAGSARADVIAEGDIKPYLSASDLVVTMYSNVATEAAILGRNLLIVKPETGELPIPVDEFGFGQVARENEAVRETVVRYFEDTEFRRKCEQEQSLWRDANPIMVEGASRLLIAQRLVQKYAVNSSREPLREVVK